MHLSCPSSHSYGSIIVENTTDVILTAPHKQAKLLLLKRPGVTVCQVTWSKTYSGNVVEPGMPGPTILEDVN